MPSLIENIKSQLRSVIQWNDTDPEVLFFRYTDSGDEIKNASKLIVGPGQGCIVVYEGKIESTISSETMLNLKTDNHPFITTILRFLQAFESEHKLGLYFFRSADILNRRWGTVSPVKYSDPVYRFPVSMGMFGNYSFKITYPETFFRNVVAGENLYLVKNIQNVILSRITQDISDYLANSKFSHLDIDARLKEIAASCLENSRKIFEELGFGLLDFRVEGNRFDDDTLARIGKIADMTAENLAAREAGLDYTEMQKLQALRDAARNEGGLAGAGLQFGAGFHLGNMMTDKNKKAEDDDVADRLKRLKSLFEQGLINDDEYREKKNEIMKNL